MAAPPPPNGSAAPRQQWQGAAPGAPATNGFRPPVPTAGAPRASPGPMPVRGAASMPVRGAAPMPARSPMMAPTGAPLQPRASPRPPAQRAPLPPAASPRPPVGTLASGPPRPAANGAPHPGAMPSGGAFPAAPTAIPRGGPSPAPTTANRRRAYPAPAAMGMSPAPVAAPMQPQGTGSPMGRPPASGYGAPPMVQSELFTPGAPDMPAVVPSQAVNEASAYGVVPAAPADFGGGMGGVPAMGGDPTGLAQQMGGMRLASNGGAAPMAPMGMGGAVDPSAMMGPQGSLLSTVNLSGMPPDPYASDARPPVPKLPPGANMTMSPFANADPVWQRCTLAAMPTTASLLAKTNIPLGLILTPNRSVPPAGSTEGVAPVDQVPLVDEPIIVRCRKCRTYINPFVQFTDNGNRWRCAICGVGNEVPSTFDWDHETNQPRDRWTRPELNSAVVEFIAPREYMVRSPQAPTYVFLIDVTINSIRNGMAAHAAQTILDSLDEIPNADGRTRVGFIAVDQALHVFSVADGSTEPEILVVSDLDDPFLPKPTDILMNLAGARAGIEALLKGFPDMFAATTQVASGMGSALQTAFQLVSPTGGKIVTLTSTLPTIGIGALKVRDDPKLLGTSKESSLLQAGTQFYKTFPIDCARAQVSIDMWLFSSSYTDVASLACLPRYTGGETFFYPGFNATNTEEATKFHTELNKVLRSPIGLEAILRVRTSRGIRPTAFHGNFFVRSSDLLAMSAVPLDQNYAVELEIEENITTPIVLFQAVLLHSTSFGERRIRVINLALPTTTNLSEVYASADQQAITMLLANKSVERAISYRLEDARDAVFNKLVDIFVGYKQAITGSAGGVSAALSMSQSMALLPLLLLALLKNPGLKESAQLPPDLRAYAQALLTTLPSERVLPYLVPNLYSLHNMPPAAGTWVETDGVSQFVLPPRLNLTSEKFERHGLYLIEDGLNMFLWLGRDAVPQLMIDVFGVGNQAEVPGGKTLLPELDNKMNGRVRALVEYIRTCRKGPFYPTLYVVKEGGDPALRQWALSQLVEDRDPGPGGVSYAQFLNKLRERVNVAK